MLPLHCVRSLICTHRYIIVVMPPLGPFGAEKRHRAHLRNEDFEKSRHAGERTGKVFVSTRVLKNVKIYP